MEDTKKYITSLLTSTPLTMTIQALDRDYRNTIGEPIPYHKLGYKSLEHFLKSIPDTVQVRGSGQFAELLPVISPKSAHVNQLVTKQRVTRKSGSGPSRYSFPSGSNNLPSSTNKRRIHYPITYQSSSGNSSRNSTISSVSSAAKLDSDSAGKHQDSSTNKPHDNATNPVISNSINKPTSQLYDNVTKPVVSNSMNKPPVSISKPPNALQYLNSSHTKLTEKSITKPIDRVSPKQPTTISESKIVSLPRKGAEVGQRIKPPTENSERNVPCTVRQNLKILISKFPDGVWCADVPSIYRKMFRQELRYQELGFGSLIALCSCLTSIFHYARPSTEDFKLYDRSRPLPDCAEKKFTVASYSVKESVVENSNALPIIEWKDVMNFHPEGIFKPGEELPRAFVPNTTKVNDTIYVKVDEIYDISKFWVHMDDGVLDNLMDDLQKFYTDHASEYQMPEYLIREGMYCVQVIFNEYHRALVVDVMPEEEGTIRVVFIDYGTNTKVSTKGLCFLYKDFAQLPVQAIRCRLAGIQPPVANMPWSRDATKQFRQLVMNKVLSAKVMRIDWKDVYLEIYLADITDSDNIFYINDRLVDDEFAIYTDQEQSKSLSVYKPIVKRIYLFPTFDELEYGLAPSTLEMEVFHDCNVPINLAYPQYFEMESSSEEYYVKNIEEFYEKNCVKPKRDIAMHFYDVLQFKPAPLNFSLFGELESEIRDFIKDDCGVSRENSNSVHTEPSNSVSEYKIDDSSKDSEILSFVNALKKDCLLAEDIMKDLQSICGLSIASTADNLPRELWTIDEENSLNSSFSPKDIDKAGKEYKDVFAENNFDQSPSDDLVHPLSKMVFSNKCSSSSHSSESYQDFEDSLEEMNLVDDLSSPEHAEDMEEYFDDVQEEGKNVSFCETNSEAVGADPQGTLRNTNPFLENLNGEIILPNEKEIALQIGTLKSNNPFLNYLDNKEDGSESSDASSGSTVYGTFTEEISVKKTWSTRDCGSVDRVSRLETLSSYSSSADSLAVEKKQPDCTTSAQTSDDDNKSFRSVDVDSISPFQPKNPPGVPPPYSAYGYQSNWLSCPPYHPPPLLPAPYPYGYPPHSYDPRYNMYPSRVNPMVMPTYRPIQPEQYKPAIPRVCPPPGFAPNSNIYQNSNSQVRMPGLCFQMSSANYAGPVQFNAVQSTTMVAPNPDASLGNDFYEQYNEQLRRKLTVFENNKDKDVTEG